MAISYITAAAANASSLTMPSHQKGDLLIGIAYRHNDATPPNVPSGWIARHAFGNNNNASSFAFRTAQSASEVSGTWTNATQLIIAAYRSTSGLYLIPGGIATTGGASSENITYPAAGSLFNVSTWYIGYSGTITDDNGQIAPTGMTNRISTVATGELSLHDTNGNVALRPSKNVATTSVTFRALVCEIFETDMMIGSSGGLPLIGPGGLVY